MKIEDIRAMKTPDLYGELDRLRRQLFELRAQAVTEKLEDPTQIGKTRRDIARVMTVLQERGERDIEQHEEHLRRQAAATTDKKA